MKNIIFLISSIVLVAGCSFQAPPNQSQFKATSAFDSYTKNFLSDNNALAMNDLKRAIEHAKKSADFDALARIYLGECALKISVGVDTRCEKYIDIKELVQNNTLSSYYSFITREIQQNNTSHLPEIYEDFASYLIAKEFDKAYIEIKDMKSVSSQLISASLIRENLNEKQINKIIKIASFNGYKKSVLFWLSELKSMITDEEKKEKISKKIDILMSKK